MSVKSEVNKNTTLEKATFAGGCFWCMEDAFQKIEGVIEAVSGYTGGHKENPTYEEVSSGTTGHYEAVQITFDPSKISYEDLLSLFWRQVDPRMRKGSLRIEGHNTGLLFFITTRSRNSWQINPNKSWKNPENFKNP